MRGAQSAKLYRKRRGAMAADQRNKLQTFPRKLVSVARRKQKLNADNALFEGWPSETIPYELVVLVSTIVCRCDFSANNHALKTA